MSGQGKQTPAAPAPKGPDDKAHTNDLLDEALDESFPASDPPAMTEPVGDHFDGSKSGAAASRPARADGAPPAAADPRQQTDRNGG